MRGGKPRNLTFPYFFVGTFIEATDSGVGASEFVIFPYFFVGTFIEAGTR